MRGTKQAQRKTLVLATAITLVGIACLITGIILLVKRNSVGCEKTKGQDEGKHEKEKKVDRCSYSEEAKRSGFDVFLQKV